MKTKAFALEIKATSEDGTFEGYGSTFNGPPDSYGEVVLPGAFANSLVKHRREGTMPLMLWNHKASELPIGNWVDLAEDGKGLWAKGAIDLEDSVGARVHRALKRKAMRGLSIGYDPIVREPDKQRPGVFLLKEIDLWEISPVNFPADKRARVDNVKTEQWGKLEDLARKFRDGDPAAVKEFEEVLRDAGFPRSAAVQIASVGYAKAIRSESEGGEATMTAVKEALASMRSIIPAT